MDKEKLVNFSFEEYSGMGGRLDKEGFDKAIVLLEMVKNRQRNGNYGSSFGQADSMAKRCNLEIASEQKDYYSFLRESNIGGMDGGLCDQEIFAETLLLTADIISREQFINQNLHIFKI